MASVPLLAGQQTGSVFSSPFSHHAAVSWVNSSQPPFPAVTTSTVCTGGAQLDGILHNLSNQTGPALSPAGLVLSPAAEPFPQKLVDKIRSGQFVDMKELLADNMSLVNQLEAVQGLSPIHLLGARRPRLREISSLSAWCYSFLGYMAIRTSDPATRDQLAYARLLIREAHLHGGLGWLDYDRAFRQQAAADVSMQWNALVPGLQASTILGQRTGQGTFYTLCREVDHSRAQCALACLQPVSTGTPADPRPSSIRRRPETALNICISWNRGACIFPGQCSYRHMCATCQLSHKAKDCPQTPDGSAYKLRPGTPRQRNPIAAQPFRQ